MRSLRFASATPPYWNLIISRIKRYTISQMAERRITNPDVILKELGKCEIRCVNCHRRKTARERGWFRALMG
jgi:hypothetical protein